MSLPSSSRLGVSASLFLAFGFLPLAAVGTAAAQDSTATARIRAIVTFADQADISPREVGILKDRPPQDGNNVTAGQVILQLDDMKAQADLRVAEAKYVAAKTKADDDINIRYSRAADATAKKELERNLNSNREVPGSVPAAKIEELRLKCVETSLAIEKAEHDRKTALSEADVEAADVEAAKVAVDLCKVYSPLDGEVIDSRAHKGEAVQPGQSVIHVVRRDKLWVEGQVAAADFARSQLEGHAVDVNVVLTGGQKLRVPGKIVFVSPLTETGGNYMVRAEIQRESTDAAWPLSPGMQAEMVIPLKTADAR